MNSAVYVRILYLCCVIMAMGAGRPFQHLPSSLPASGYEYYLYHLCLLVRYGQFPSRFRSYGCQTPASS